MDTDPQTRIARGTQLPKDFKPTGASTPWSSGATGGSAGPGWGEGWGIWVGVKLHPAALHPPFRSPSSLLFPLLPPPPSPFFSLLLPYSPLLPPLCPSAPLPILPRARGHFRDHSGRHGGLSISAPAEPGCWLAGCPRVLAVGRVEWSPCCTECTRKQ